MKGYNWGFGVGLLVGLLAVMMTTLSGLNYGLLMLVSGAVGTYIIYPLIFHRRDQHRASSR